MTKLVVTMSRVDVSWFMIALLTVTLMVTVTMTWALIVTANSPTARVKVGLCGAVLILVTFACLGAVLDL